MKRSKYAPCVFSWSVHEVVKRGIKIKSKDFRILCVDLRIQNGGQKNLISFGPMSGP